MNPAAAPRAPVADDRPLAPPPKFPKVATLAAAAPTQARLLPDRFAVAGYVLGEHVGTWWAAPIPASSGSRRGRSRPATRVDGRGRWLDAQGLEWTVDFEAAERVGIRIDCGSRCRASTASTSCARSACARRPAGGAARTC